MIRLLCALAAIATLALGCSIDRRSGRLECERTADCDPGRVCNDGLCVASSGGDASIPDGETPGDAPPDSNGCPDACTSCSGTTCTVDCAAPGADCSRPIACPAGWNCAVRCTEEDPCTAGISCGLARSCDVDCAGANACRDIACGAGRCDVACTGEDACRGVDCAASCGCDVVCSGAFSCRNVECPSLACSEGRGCSSEPLGCNTCL